MKERGTGMRPLLALCVLGLACVSMTACGGAHKSATPIPRASSIAAATTTPSTTSTESAVSGEEEKLDADKDKDINSPDEDDKGKPPPLDRDNDSDSNGKSYFDSDDKNLLDFGHAANTSDRQTVTSLVRRYYAAAAAEDGAKACSMIYSNYAEAVPEDYGTSPPGPPYARGTTCPTVLTLIFKHFHNQVASRLPKLAVSRVRIKERQGLAILSFGTLSGREIHFVREGHAWKLEALLDSELP